MSDPRQPHKVLQVIRPAAGGMKAHVLQIATGLRSSGFDSEIACPNDPDLVHDALEQNLLVHPVPIVGPLRPPSDLIAVWVLAEVIRERRPDLIHAHGAKAGLIARFAAMLVGRPPVIVTVHNDVLYGRVGSVVRRTYVAVERFLGRRTARVVAVSGALRDEMVDVVGLPSRLVVTVRNGVDLTPFLAPHDGAAVRTRLGVPADALLFGLAARFAPQKALDVLVDAAVPLLERDERAWLVIAGDGPLLESVKTKARAAKVRDRIVFPGFETDVPGLLAALDLYVSPAISEGLGIGTIEAMASGLPVVATCVGGTPEVVVDGVTGVLVAPRKPAPLTEAIGRLLKDAPLRRAMGEAGRERAIAEFGQERMLDRVAEVYAEVLA